MKKIISILAVFVVLIGIVPVVSADELQISSASVVLIEQSTGNVLYEVNKDESRAIASITKVMTLILTMEALEDGYLKLDDVLVTSAYAASMGGSDIWLVEGEAMSVDDLLKATVIMSANDAAVVLAEAIAGSEDAFVVMMNEKAQELGMTNTVFMNCNGLDEDGHVSTAYDVALMSSELICHEQIMDYTLTWIDYIRDNQTQLVNTNKMIRTYSGITGLKTGTTSTAGSCITSTATRDGMTLIAVVLGASTTDIRFSDATTLLNYGFAKWCIATPEITIPNEIDVKSGMSDTVSVELVGQTDILTELTGTGGLVCEIEYEEDLAAPISVNQTVGKVYVMNGSECMKELEIIATEEVEELSFKKVLYFLLSKFIL